MKPILFVSLLVGATLYGCAAQRAPTSDYIPAQGGPGYGAGSANTVPGDRPAAGAQGASSTGATAGGPDSQSMCALQKRLDAAKSEQERQAIIDETMAGMTPDLRQQHLEMLRQQCH